MARITALYGKPTEMAIDVPMREWEFNLLRFSKRDGRFRDATILIPYEGKLVCIVKHAYPDGIARPPSGGVVPGEPLDAAAEREAYEETGLRVRLERYLLRCSCHFTLGSHATPSAHALAEASRKGRQEDWVFDQLAAFAAQEPPKADEPEYWESHVFWARPVGGSLEPKDDAEVKAVVLLAPDELEDVVHARMKEADIGGFQYRVALQDAALAAARAAGLLPSRTGREPV
ncbi:MAG TPA: NUDIX domain-containing protein [Candidatus Thermoplasmatota archaeon]|nr:NUDIX domain-containing protein [Candidatus Thermoplasmatota archaeon]